MENNSAQQKMIVDIEEINKQEGQIYINDRNGSEGWFQVVYPANVNFCKLGEANITMSNGVITYARSTQASQPQVQQAQRQYPQRNNYQKPQYQPKTYQHKQITQGNDYKPKEECYYEETEVLFEGVGFVESQKIVEDLKKQGKWVFYVQRLSRYGDFKEDEKGVTHYMYDVAVGIKEKRQGKRPEGPQEEYI
jgi:hypothetical protein